MSYIKLENIKKYYKKGTPAEVRALNGLNLEIEKGEIIAVKGVSGSGKSTLLHIMGCLDKADSGNYFLDGVDVGRLKNEELARLRNKKIGFVLQQFGLVYERTALDNVCIPLYFSKEHRKNPKEKALEIMEKLDIENLANRKASELSGGQKQRVAIARALVNDPELILADEPTGALDSKTSKDIMEVLLSLQKTLVIVTHEQDIADVCSRTVEILDGQIV